MTDTPTAPATDAAAAAAGPSRRQVLLTTGVVAAAAAVTAACGSSDTGSTSTPTSGGAGSESPAASESAGSGSGGTTVSTADVPVGGGTIVAGVKVVVTQPEAGTYKAFSSTCTHQGCQVSEVKDNKIVCPCHGSVFSASDGAVESGPAQGALAPASITVSGDTITIA
jgi:Rieske Fe-S protein